MMKLQFLLALSCGIGLQHESAAQDEILRGRNGEVLGSESDAEQALGGTFGNPFASQLQATVIGRNLINFTIDSTQIPGSSWSEEFLVGFPDKPIQPTPVLVLFHGYGETPQDVLDNSDFFEMGMKRGWIVVAPLGAHKYNYGIEYSQLNVEAALSTLAGTLAPSLGMTVDANRFYAVGFSMGGGAAASFAARHADTDSGLHFAGTAIHTGSTSLSYTYWSTPGVQSLFDSPLMFGGAPNDPALSFDYSRASGVDLGWTTALVDQKTDMVRNLTHMPLYSYYAAGDPNTTLITQTKASHHQFRKRGGTGRLKHSSKTKHDWQTLREARVFRIFESHAFEAPDSSTLTRTLADRDGDWHGFSITQGAARLFSPFRWVIQPQFNRVVVDEVSNIKVFELPSPTAVGLDPNTVLEVLVDSADGAPMDIVLGEIATQPTDVQRNGQSTASWSYDAATQKLVLFESSKGSYPRWTVVN